jgi:2-octaprenyl-6-methoxyphenol hydroxylase
LETTPTAWPITWQLADALTGPRSVLVAEAAHALPPSGAQGLNLSLRDVAELTTLLTQVKKLGLDPGSATLLNQYQRARTRDMIPRAHAVDGLNRLILTENPLARRLRRAGLFTAATLPPLRRTIMRFGWSGG